jgi:hypothetical protein
MRVGMPKVRVNAGLRKPFRKIRQVGPHFLIDFGTGCVHRDPQFSGVLDQTHLHGGTAWLSDIK